MKSVNAESSRNDDVLVAAVFEAAVVRLELDVVDLDAIVYVPVGQSNVGQFSLGQLVQKPTHQPHPLKRLIKHAHDHVLEAKSTFSSFLAAGALHVSSPIFRDKVDVADALNFSAQSQHKLLDLIECRLVIRRRKKVSNFQAFRY